MPIYELKFTNGSFEYRPGRSPKDAVQKIKEYAEQEYTNTKTEEEQNKEKREEVRTFDNVHDKPDISYEENKIVHHLKFMIFWNFDREYYIKNGG